MTSFSPREIVSELDRHIVGQADAKRAVAIALRNRWRRQQLPDELREEVLPKNILMIGPTGIGKTALAVALARYWPLVVISADSRQVYRGLDAGTGKPTADERRSVEHVGLDVLDPGERYSAGRFAHAAVAWLSAIPATRRAVIVGGTGLYIRALADGLFREPPLDAARRAELARWTGGARTLEAQGRSGVFVAAGRQVLGLAAGDVGADAAPA